MTPLHIQILTSAEGGVEVNRARERIQDTNNRLLPYSSIRRDVDLSIRSKGQILLGLARTADLRGTSCSVGLSEDTDSHFCNLLNNKHTAEVRRGERFKDKVRSKTEHLDQDKTMSDLHDRTSQC